MHPAEETAPISPDMDMKTFVLKRDGRKQAVDISKIQQRIVRLAAGLDHVEALEIVQKVVEGLMPGISTVELDTLAAESAASRVTKHPNNGILAARCEISNLVKTVEKTVVEEIPLTSFSNYVRAARAHVHKKTGKPAPLLQSRLVDFILANAEEIEGAMDDSFNNRFNFFGFRTIKRGYLIQSCEGVYMETPQWFYMRVALGLHCTEEGAGPKELALAFDTYSLLAQGFFTHATPCLFNAGTTRPQLSSCFLVNIKEDSIDGIYATLGDCARLSKYAGGVGLSIHKIRATDSYIRGTNGASNGLVPMLKVYSDTARYVDQGGGKRKGAFAVYLEPWHADIFAFLDLRKNTGKEEERARDIFTALWTPDLFMRRVQEGGTWTIMCPNECPGLAECWGEAFETLYTKYEAEGRGRATIPAQDLWCAILEAQIETGTPYMLFKDAVNRKSNHQHLGTIKSSNLCTEIMEYSAPDETAVCNLASIAIPMFVKKGVTGYDPVHPEDYFDFSHFMSVVRTATRNTNRVIDINFYATGETLNSNMRHRPIGLGVQGLADAFALLRIAFTSPEARALNRHVFEALYFAALSASCELAVEEGTYLTYPGSPVSKGILQPDMWGVTPSGVAGLLDWGALRKRIATHGVRNSLLVAPMPTASTAQILGNNEAFEPFTSNIYTRRVLSGDFTVTNKHLAKEMVEMGLWHPKIVDMIKGAKGSVQALYWNRGLVSSMAGTEHEKVLPAHVVEAWKAGADFPAMVRDGVAASKKNATKGVTLTPVEVEALETLETLNILPAEMRERYKTVWEIKQRDLIDMAAERAPYIDQSMSFNLHISGITKGKLGGAHFHTWRSGLKTGMYYLRTRPAADAQAFTVKKERAPVKAGAGAGAEAPPEKKKEEKGLVVEEDDCLSCGA